MNWLNINLMTLRSPAYLGSNPAQQATWLKLLAWCADQENGGRIEGAAAWKDRQWLQICGVSAREVRAASRLVTIEGGDVRVAFYPVEKEAEVQARRIAATEAANRRWHGKLKRGGGEDQEEESCAPIEAPVRAAAAANNDTPPHASRIAPVNAEEKEKEKENEKGMYASPADGAPQVRDDAVAADGVESRGRLCSLRAAVLHGMRLEPPCPEQWAAKWWEDCEKRGWVDNHGIALQQWRPALSSYWRGVQEQDRRAFGTLPSGIAGKGNAAGSAGDINARLKGIDEELGRLRIKAQDGRSPDGLRTVKIYTPEQETRRDQLLAAKEVLKRKLTEVG